MTAAAAARVAAVGGGHGLSRALEALRRLDVAPTAVVTVADDGGSTGRLRRELDIIALGDLRRALVTLGSNAALAGVLAHRFERGALEGHALGNLLLVALAERAGGDFVAALDEAARLLDCRGRALPATLEPVQLKARVSGEEIDGQVRVATAEGRVERVWLEPESPPACPEAARALAEADVVLLGPGSLFTSVIATLLVPGLAAALTDHPGTIVAVANLRTQPGETAGLDAAAHLDALFDHVPGLRLDAVVFHDGPPAQGPGTALAPIEDPRIGAAVRADVLSRGPDGAPGAGHDAERLAAALAPLLARA